MARIAVLNESPEVVALLARALSPRGHTLLKHVGDPPISFAALEAFAPDLILLGMLRSRDSFNRPLGDYHTDVLGARQLERISAHPALREAILILFGFATDPDDMPADFRRKVRYDAFLAFPEGLQDLNPTVTAYLRGLENRRNAGP